MDNKLKVVAKVRNTMLVPTVAYGNMTLEATVELEDYASPDFYEIRLRELQIKAQEQVMISLQEQKDALNEMDKSFFKLPA